MNPVAFNSPLAAANFPNQELMERELIQGIMKTFEGKRLQAKLEEGKIIELINEWKSVTQGQDLDRQFQQILSSPNFDIAESQKFEAKLRLTKIFLDHKFETAKQGMQLLELKHQIPNEYDEQLKMIFSMRKQQLDEYEKLINLNMAQEKHQAGLELEKQSQKLKEQEQAFSQFIELQKLKLQRHEIENRKEIESKRFKNEQKLGEQQVKLQEKELNLKKIQYNHQQQIEIAKLEVEKGRIQANANAQILQARYAQPRRQESRGCMIQ